MSNTGVVNAEVRTVSGSGDARRLRRQGLVPCVLQGLGGVPSAMLQVSGHELKMMLKRHTGENLLLNLVIDGGSPRKVLMKEVQHDPITGEIIHLDFLEVSMTETMESSVSLALVGTPVGVTEGGGVLEQVLREVAIECLPDNMVEEIEVDVSGLKIGDMLNVGDLKAPDGVTIVTSPDIGVALVSAPRTEEDESEDGAGEPERVGESEAADSEESKDGKG